MQKHMKNTIKNRTIYDISSRCIKYYGASFISNRNFGTVRIARSIGDVVFSRDFYITWKATKENEKTRLKTAQSMILVAIALNLMALPLIILGLIPWQKLIVALGAILGIVGIFILLGKATKKMKNSIKNREIHEADSRCFRNACYSSFYNRNDELGIHRKRFGCFNRNSRDFYITWKATKKMKNTIKTAAAMMLVASSLIIASIPLVILGLLEWSTIWKGVIGMSVIAMSMTALGYMGSKLKKALSTATAIILISASLVVASIPLVILGFLDWNTLIRGVVGIIAIAVVLGGLAFIGGKIQNSLKNRGNDSNNSVCVIDSFYTANNSWTTSLVASASGRIRIVGYSWNNVVNSKIV